MKINIPLIILFLTLTACQPVLRTVTGVKQPRYETKETLSSFLEEYGIDQQDVFTLNYEQWQATLGDGGGRLPDFYFFDKEGYRLGEPKICLPPDSNYIETIIEANDHQINRKPEITDFNIYKMQLLNLEGEKKQADCDPGKYKMVVIWAKFGGKHYMKKTLDIVDMAKKSKFDFDVYYVNVDPQEFWPEDIKSSLVN